MAFGYDFTINLYHLIERQDFQCAVNAINVLVYFVIDTLLFQLLAKHSSAALSVSNLLTSVNA